MQRLRRALEPLIRRVLHFYWRFSRGATLGVRAMVIDGTGRVFLVKHSYVDGWHLPGGGVETGETLLDGAGARTGRGGQYRADGAAGAARHLSSTRASSRRDHVALYIVRDFRQESAPQPDHEIVAHGFFAPDALPAGTSRATRARIAEVFGGVAGQRGVVRGICRSRESASLDADSCDQGLPFAVRKR